jgi:hypothetical protein
MPHIIEKDFRYRLYCILPELMMLTVIVLIGWVYTFGIEQVLDIGLYGESSYLARGKSVPYGFLSPWDAPLYALWYYFLSLFQHDTVALYYLNAKAMTILPALLVFLFLRVNRVCPFASFVSACGVLLSAANFPTWPKVGHFALLIFLSGCVISSLLRDRKHQVLTLAMCALLSSYVLPEFFVSFVILAMIYVFIVVKAARGQSSVTPSVTLLFPFIVCVLIVLDWGVPVSGDRSMAAFSQHYAWNWVSWHNDPRDPWTHSEEIIRGDFGDVRTPEEALISNPLAVARHIQQNLRVFPSSLTYVFGNVYPRSRPATIGLELAAAVLFFGLCLLISKESVKAFAEQIAENGRHRSFLGLLLLIILLPVILSIILIAPRTHYVLILGMMSGLAFLVLFLGKTVHDKHKIRYSSFALICLLPLLAVHPLGHHDASEGQKNLKTILFLRSLKINERVNVLEAEGGFGIYAGENYKRVAQYDKKGDFRSFLNDSSINLVVLSDRLCADSRFSTDSEWLAFIESPMEWGFVRMDVPKVAEYTLLVRKTLLRSRNKLEK